MTRNNEPTQRLTNAAELLEMLEHIFASRGSSYPQGSEFPWSGVKLTLSLAREQLEAARADLGTNGPTPGKTNSNRNESPAASQVAPASSAITASTIIGSSPSQQYSQPHQVQPLSGKPPVHGAANAPLNFQGSKNPQAPAAATLAPQARAESPAQPRNLSQQNQPMSDPVQTGLNQGQPDRRARETQGGISPSLASRIQRVPVRTEQVAPARPESRSGDSQRGAEHRGNTQRNGEQRSAEPRNGGQQSVPARNGTPRQDSPQHSPQRQERPAPSRPAADVASPPKARAGQGSAEYLAGQSSAQSSGSPMGIAKLGRVREIDPEAYDYDEPDELRPDTSATGADREGASRKTLVANQKSV